jgi:hypothetical protein
MADGRWTQEPAAVRRPLTTTKETTVQLERITREQLELISGDGDGLERITIGPAPSVVLIFETEGHIAMCVPENLTDLRRVLLDLGPYWRNLVLSHLDEDERQALADLREPDADE